MNNRSHLRVPVAFPPNDRIRWLSLVALAMIASYRLMLSPVLFSIWGPACRFEPSCSAYAAEAISRYGIARGGWMALKRLLRCQPLGRWGFDPVPAAAAQTELTSASIETRRNKWNIVGY